MATHPLIPATHVLAVDIVGHEHGEAIARVAIIPERGGLSRVGHVRFRPGDEDGRHRAVDAEVATLCSLGLDKFD